MPLTKKRKRNSSSKSSDNDASSKKPKNTLLNMFAKQKQRKNGATASSDGSAAQVSSSSSGRPKKRLRIMNSASQSKQKQQQQKQQNGNDAMSDDSDDEVILFDHHQKADASSRANDENFLRNAPSSSNFKGTQFFSSIHSPSQQKNQKKLLKYDLWAEKYRPKALSDLVGNQAKIDQLSDWLRGWNGKWRRNKAKKAGTKKAKASDFRHKSILIYGKPGIGKTTAAKLVAESLGFQVLEMNASDTRSKNSLKDSVRQLVDNQSMFRFCSGDGGFSKKQCLIMDEVDGMSTGDRGGVAELLKIIRESKIPIICIANDGRDQKLKTLLSNSLGLQFDSPSPQVILVKMKKICEQEGLKITDHALRDIIASLEGDIRAIITNLQFISKRQTKERSTNVTTSASTQVEKSAQIPNIFSLANAILTYNQVYPPRWQQMHPNQKIDHLRHCARPLKEFTQSYFYDTMFIPLLVQQNYVNIFPRILGNLKEPIRSDQHFKRLSSASEYISFSDTVERRIRRDQAWELSNLHAATSTVAPSIFVRGQYQRVLPYDSNQIKFPAILGKFSAARKNQTEIDDLSKCISTVGSSSGGDLVMDGYAELLDQKFGKMLKTQDGIEEALDLMEEYNLSRSDLDLLAKHASHTKRNEVSFSNVSGTTKRALTNAYKKRVGGESITQATKSTRSKALNDLSNSDEDDEDEFKPVVKKLKSGGKKRRK